MPPPPVLSAYLRSLDAETLAELLLDRAERDPELRAELEARASANTEEVAEVHRMLSDGPDGESFSYATKVGSVLDTLQRLLDGGTRADVAPLARRMIDQIGAALGRMEDSGGLVGGQLERAVTLYARACAARPPSPPELAEWIARTEFGPGLAEIELADFADALGEPGLAHLKSIVDEVLAGPGDDPRRGAAERLRESLAEVSGDVDALVEILSAKPQRLDISLKIVRVLRGAGRHTEAIAHAAKALAHDKGAARAPVVDELAGAYREAGQGDEALTLRRNEFQRVSTHAAYLALREAASALGCWDAERDTAMDLLRARAEQSPDAADELVRVLLTEERADDAWEVSCRLGQSLPLRLELAELREAEHPVDVIPVYRVHVEELIAHKDAFNYREAAKQLRKLRALHKRADTAEEFSAYLAELVETHKRKTRLLAEVRNARIALPRVGR